MTDEADKPRRGRTGKRMMYLNPLPSSEPTQDGSDRTAVVAEFAKRVQRRMIMKSWNQSDLARQASVFLSEKAGKRKNMGRDRFSHYVRGINLPTPAQPWESGRASCGERV